MNLNHVSEFKFKSQKNEFKSRDFKKPVIFKIP